MIAQISTPDLLLWLCVVISEVALAITVISVNLFRRYLAFAIFAVAPAAKSLILLYILTLQGSVPYGYANIIGSLVLTGLVLLAAAELYVQILGPKAALPEGTISRIAFLLVLTYPACLMAALLCFRHSYSRLANGLQTSENFFWGVAALSLWVLVWEARRLGLSFIERYQGIVLGLAFFTTTTLIGTLLITRLPSRPAIMAVQRVAQAASLLAFLFWSFYLRRPAVETFNPTPEQDQALLAVHRHTATEVESMIAGHS